MLNLLQLQQPETWLMGHRRLSYTIFPYKPEKPVYSAQSELQAQIFWSFSRCSLQDRDRDKVLQIADTHLTARPDCANSLGHWVQFVLPVRSILRPRANDLSADLLINLAEAMEAVGSRTL